MNEVEIILVVPLGPFLCLLLRGRRLLNLWNSLVAGFDCKLCCGLLVVVVAFWRIPRRPLEIWLGSIWLDCKEDQGLGKNLKKKKCRRKLCRLVSDGREMM